MLSLLNIILSSNFFLFFLGVILFIYYILNKKNNLNIFYLDILSFLNPKLDISNAPLKLINFNNSFFFSRIFSLGFFINIFLCISENYFFKGGFNILNGDFNDNYNFIFLIKLLILFFSFLIFLILPYFFKQEKNILPEFVFLLYFATLALFNIILSNNFVYFFLNLELQTLCLVILCTSLRKKKSNFSAESSLKLYVMSAVSSGLFLLGLSLLYGFCGSLSFSVISNLFNEEFYDFTFVILISLFLILVSFLFKLGVPPFHLWLKEIYEGAPLSTVIYISIIPKIAIMGAMFKIFFELFPVVYNSNFLFFILLILSSLAILIGIIGAIYQKKIRSFIAYSSITNLGYFMFFLSNMSSSNVDKNLIGSVVIIFIFIYGISIVNLLLVNLSCFYHWSNKNHLKYLSQLSGLYKCNGIVGLIFSFNLFSLIGLPPLAGFFIKFFFSLDMLFSSSYLFTFYFLLFGVFASFYYLRVIKFIFLDKMNKTLFLSPAPRVVYGVIIINSLLLVLLFLNPEIINLIYIFISNI